MNRRPRPAAALVWGLALLGIQLCFIQATRAATYAGYAAMGASETAGTSTDYKGSWVPWLANQRGLNFGPATQYNVAIGGNTTTTLLSNGQHTEVAGYVADGNVDIAFLFIGGLDIPPVLLNLIGGTLDVPTWANGVVGRMMTAVDEVLDENPAGLVVSGLPDMTLIPGAAQYNQVPEVAAPVIAAIDYTNALIKSEVLARNLVYIDTASAMRDLNAAPFVVGGVTINMTTGNSTNPRFFFQDNIHPGFVGNGFFANLMATALNDGYDTNIPLFTDQEILNRAGLTTSYTGETSNVDFSKYIYFNAVPEPSSWALAAIGMTTLIGVLVRRRRLEATESTP